MQVAIRKMGNSQGILLPKPILMQLGLRDVADLQINNGVLEVRPVRSHVRAGWAEDSARLAQEGDDALVWPDVANEGDEALVW